MSLVDSSRVSKDKDRFEKIRKRLCSQIDVEMLNGCTENTSTDVVKEGS